MDAPTVISHSDGNTGDLDVGDAPHGVVPHLDVERLVQRVEILRDLVQADL